MPSFGSSIISLTIIGFFTLNAVAKPQHRHGAWSGTVPSPVAAASSPAVPVPPTTTTSSSGSSDEEVSTPSSSATPSSGSNTPSSSSDSSSGGSGSSGQASIVNKCSFPTYLVVCIQNPASCGSTHTLAANTGSYSEAYGPATDGGHSLKISTSQGSGDILQFEYTNEGNGDISYDLSEVNGNPFGQYGFTLTNTTANAYCAPPATNCPAIFTQPTNGIPYQASTSEGVGATLCG